MWSEESQEQCSCTLWWAVVYAEEGTCPPLSCVPGSFPGGPHDLHLRHWQANTQSISFFCRNTPVARCYMMASYRKKFCFHRGLARAD